MDGLDLHEVGQVFSCCEPCVRNKRCKQIILVLTFVLMTFDTVTDWINWVQWSGVGGYELYYFASIFERVFLCVAAVGTGLWIIEVFVTIKKWINIYQENHQRSPPKYERKFHEFLPNPVVNYSLSKQEVGNCNRPEVRKYAEPDVRNNNEHLFDPEVKNYPEPGTNKEEGEESTNQSSSEPAIQDYSKRLSEQELRKYTEPEPEVRNEDKPPSELEVRNEDKPPSELEVRNEDKPPSELEVRNEDKPPSELEVRNEDKPPSELEVRNENKFPSETEVRNENETLSEPGVRHENKPPSGPEVRNEDIPLSEPEVRNDNDFGKTEDEQEEKMKGSRAIVRLGIVVRILVGLLEDLPVVLVVYYSTVMPICGIPAKQSVGSGITLATIISSMLNSLWTMVCLLCEMSGCTERGFYCIGTAKHKKDKNANVEDTDSHIVECCHRQDDARCLKRPSKLCMKKAFLKGAKIILCIVIFILFSSTFTLGFWTVGHVLGFISLRFTEVSPFMLVPYVPTGHYGAGLDAKPDQAMFIYLHYQLPDWHYITLNGNAFTKSASFRNVINRLYIGQFGELRHLKNGTLTKAISCSRAMPFFQNFDRHTFYWVNHDPVVEEEYANCKIIFTLRYFPTNNNWQPFTNFIHDFRKFFITIEFGIHINNNKTCPAWFYPPYLSSFLSDQVQEDIVNYSCNSACSEDRDICQNVKSWNIDNNQEMNSSSESVELWHLSFAVNDLKTPDTCMFNVRIEQSHKFCDESWGEVDPVLVPEKIKGVYPQFITVPITTWYDENLDRDILKNSCRELWQSGERLEVD